jgi:hypothetical protein
MSAGKEVIPAIPERHILQFSTSRRGTRSFNVLDIGYYRLSIRFCTVLRRIREEVVGCFRSGVQERITVTRKG